MTTPWRTSEESNHQRLYLTVRASPSSQDEVWILQLLLHRAQERWWVTTNLGPACPEPGPSPAPVQDVDAEIILSMHLSLSSLVTDRFFALRSKGEHISTLSPYRGSSPRSFEGKRHSHSQLPRRLAHIGPVSSTVV